MFWLWLFRQSTRPLWQTICRVVVVLALALVGAYVAMPVWIPTGVVRERLAASISRQIGLDCRIESLSVSWSKGVRIDNLSIEMPPGFGGGDLLSVESISADFSPIKLLLGGRLGWMVVDRPRLNVFFGGDGQVNLPALKNLSADVRVDLMTVRDGAASLHFAMSDRPLSIQISDLQVQGGRGRVPGQVVMSGLLIQEGASAPLELRAEVGTRQGFAVASASVDFADVDLKQLPLPQLLDLRLDELTGRCSGSVDLQLNRQLVVDQFSVDLDISNLYAQPTGGPPMPVIEHAEIKITAAVDLLSNRIECRSVRVHLPGVDLDGTAVVFTEIRRGAWEAIESVNLHGAVAPSVVAAMLTGKGQLPGDIEVDGIVAVELDAKRTGSKLALQVALEGSDAEIRRRGKALKLAGTELSVRFAGVVDERDWQLRVDTGQLRLGQNRFWGAGIVRGANRIFRQQRAGFPSPLGEVIGCLAHLDWRGHYEIRELDSLSRALGTLPIGGMSDQIKLRGLARGEWVINNKPGRILLQGALEIPPETELAVEGRFVKPEGVGMTAGFATAVDHEAMRFEQVCADLTIGEGKVNVDQGFIQFEEAGEGLGGWTIRAGGKFEAARAESILAGVTPIATSGLELRGRIAGRFETDSSGGLGSLRLWADLTDTDVVWRDVAIKQVSEPGAVELDLRRGATADGKTVRRLAVRGTLPQLALQLEAVVPDASGWSWSEGLLTGKLYVKDLAWVVNSYWPLRDRFGDGKLGGALEAQFEGSWSESDLAGEIRLNADGVEFVSADPSLGAKAAGVPLRLRVTGEVAKRGERILAQVKSSSVDFGASRFGVSGRAVLDGNRDSQQDKQTLWSALRRFDAQIDVRCEGDDALERLVPSANDWIRHCQLYGRIEVAAELTGQRAWSGSIAFEDFGGSLRGKEVLLDGVIGAGGVGLTDDDTPKLERLSVDGLRFEIGQNRGWLVAQLSDVLSATGGQVHLLCEYLDDKDLIDWFTGATGPTTQPPKLSPAQVTTALDRADRIVSVLKEIAANTDMTVHLEADRFKTYDASVDQFYDVRQLVVDATITLGRVDIRCLTGVNGGSYRDHLAIDLTEAFPLVARQMEITDVVAEDNIQPQLGKFFPGNTVFGYFNRVQDLEMPLRDLVAFGLDGRFPLHPTGTGKTVTVDGQVEGRSAPKFVTAVFPGLNLTKYRYKTMTGFSQFLPDGTALNDMIFNGPVYDVYMEGKTDADNIGVYDIGVILLGSSPEWQHEWKQVRIPILKFKGRIEGGKIYDEKISYFWPNETLFIIFLRNNIFYRIWLHGRGK